MSPDSCGVWLGPRTLVGVLLTAGCARRPVHLPLRSEEARQGLIAYLLATSVTELVLPESVTRHDSLGRIAVDSGISVWIAPRVLVDPLRQAAGIAPGRTVQTAALLARLARIPPLRVQLRRLEAQDPGRQLNLL